MVVELCPESTNNETTSIKRVGGKSPIVLIATGW